MSGNAQWLIEAIEKKQLIYSRDAWGNIHTLEPHLYGLALGNQEVVIAYQVDGGRRNAPSQGWAQHGLSSDLWSDSKKRFAAVREVPAHYRERIRTIFAEASSR